jgi:hypothetical protein
LKLVSLVPRKAYTLTEDEAVVTLAVDVPFKVRGRQTRIVPAEWAERITREFQELGKPAPKGIRP